MASLNCTLWKLLAHSAVIEEGWATNRSTFSFYKDMLFDLQRGRQTVKIYWTRHKGTSTSEGVEAKKKTRERLYWPKRLSYCYPWLTWVTFDTPSIFGAVSFSLCVDYFSAFCSHAREICRVEFWATPWDWEKGDGKAKEREMFWA